MRLSSAENISIAGSIAGIDERIERIIGEMRDEFQIRQFQSNRLVRRQRADNPISTRHQFNIFNLKKRPEIDRSPFDETFVYFG